MIKIKIKRIKKIKRSKNKKRKHNILSKKHRMVQIIMTKTTKQKSPNTTGQEDEINNTEQT